MSAAIATIVRRELIEQGPYSGNGGRFCVFVRGHEEFTTA